MSKPGTQIRKHLIRSLQADLIGPFDLDDPSAIEVLSLAPSRWYRTGEQIERVEHNRMHAILPRVPKVVAAAAVGGELEALLGDGRARDVATQPLESLAIAVGHGRARVDVHATNFGERVVGLGDDSHRVRELASLLPRCIAQQLPVRGPLTRGSQLTEAHS
jgi:hypothetical protein